MLIDSAGGGGYGLPREREPDLVRADVRAGLVTEDAARSRYGVAIDGQGVAATAQPSVL